MAKLFGLKFPNVKIPNMRHVNQHHTHTTTPITKQEKETLSASELAELLNISVGFIYNVRASEPDNYNKLPKGHKVGRRVVWLKSEVLEWLSQH